MSAKKKTVDTDVVDLDPVELDPPDPALARWQKLTERDRAIYHKGDAEKIIPFPRPEWAIPYGDILGRTISRCYYTSEYAEVALRHRTGEIDAEVLDQASVKIRAKLGGDGCRTGNAPGPTRAGDTYNISGVNPRDIVQKIDARQNAAFRRNTGAHR